MPMKISDGDLLIAEEYLEKSGTYRSMNNPNHFSRAKDVLTLALAELKQRVLRDRKEKKA
jgi:hypothetical protein